LEYTGGGAMFDIHQLIIEPSLTGSPAWQDEVADILDNSDVGGGMIRYRKTGNFIKTGGDNIRTYGLGIPDNATYDGAQGPFCHLTTTASYNGVADSTATALNFNLETVDNFNIHSTSVNPSRLTINTAFGAALVNVTASVTWTASSSGYRNLFFQVDGVLVEQGAQSTNAISSGGTRQTISMMRELTVGQYVEVVAVQNSGGTLNVAEATVTLASVGRPK
jgi:hypothetical protein